MSDPLAGLVAMLPVERHAIDVLNRGGIETAVIDHVGGKAETTPRKAPDGPDSGQTMADMYVARPEDDVEPPSFLPYLSRLLNDYDASRPRSMQKRPGPSELGTPCQRQLAYKIAEYKGADIQRYESPDPPWAPIQGTMMHELMERVLAFDNERNAGVSTFDPWDIEAEARIDDNIRGSSDAFRRVTVTDWKYTGTTQLTKLRQAKRKGLPPKDQVSQEYRIQTHLYGYARALKDLPVKWVRIVFLARSWKFDDSDEWTERYDPRIAEWAISRYYTLDSLVDSLKLTDRPERWEEVPAKPEESACHWCPFRRAGGPADDTGCPGNTAEAAAKSRERFERSITPE